MSALPRARRLAALLESLVPLLTAAASENSQPPALRKAPKATVDKLPCRAYTAEEGVTRECYICLDTYEHGDKMRRLPCKHEFHAKCVDRWLLDVHRTCPCCRADVCLDGDSDEEDEDEESAASGAIARSGSSRQTPYDQLRPASPTTTPTARRTQALHNSALNSEQAAQQIEYMQSRGTLSHSLSQLQMLRSREAALVAERQRLQEMHNDLCETRRELRTELHSLRSSTDPRRRPSVFARDSLVRSSAPAALAGDGVPPPRASGAHAGGGAGEEGTRPRGSGTGGPTDASVGGLQGLQWRMLNHPRRRASPSSSDDSDEEDEEAAAGAGHVSSAYNRHVRARASSRFPAAAGLGGGRGTAAGVGGARRPPGVSGGTVAGVLRRNSGPGGSGGEGGSGQSGGGGAGAGGATPSSLAAGAADNARSNQRARLWLAQRGRGGAEEGGAAAGGAQRERGVDSFTLQQRRGPSGVRGVVTHVGHVTGVHGGEHVPRLGSRFVGGSWRYTRLQGVR